MSPQTFYYQGPFGAFGEYVRSSGGVRRGATSADITHVAWQAAASWVLTGEAATDRGVRPRYDFDPERRHWGAIQVAGRYHALAIDARGREARPCGARVESNGARCDPGRELVSEPVCALGAERRAHRVR